MQYIIAGSITKFGGEEKNYGGGGSSRASSAASGCKKAKTEVTLTARMIDATTGEILLSAKGEGVSKKGGGFKVGAGGLGGGDGFSDGLERLQGERHRRGPGGGDARRWWPRSWPRRTGSSSSSGTAVEHQGPPRAAALFLSVIPRPIR